ncbi:MAG: hypothetical protein LBR23_02620 [Spirochaetaceae bacterium]|nr:hypothetical protein [Spirochaetaceae bacterium]
MEVALETPGPESVWKILQESLKGIADLKDSIKELRESQRETGRQIRESQENTSRQMEETDRRIRALQEKTDRQISRLGNRIGDLIEIFAAANVIEKFRALGYEFTRSSRNITIEDKNRRSLAEVDIFLENGDFVMALEVKTNLVGADVTEHLHRMDVLRSDADRRGDKRKFLGAIAAAIAGKGVKELALSSGFYVLEQQGDNVRITAPEHKRVW